MKITNQKNKHRVCKKDRKDMSVTGLFPKKEKAEYYCTAKATGVQALFGKFRRPGPQTGACSRQCHENTAVRKGAGEKAWCGSKTETEKGGAGDKTAGALQKPSPACGVSRFSKCPPQGSTFPKFSGKSGRVFFPFSAHNKDRQSARRASGQFLEKGSNVKCFADFVSVLWQAW